MTEISLEFGFYPKSLDLKSSPVNICTLPELADKVKNVRTSSQVEKDWFYSPRIFTHNSSGEIVCEKPYPSRIFGLPKTHLITHESASCKDQLIFHIWNLSFFTGIHLSTLKMGFLDATPIKEGKMVDFIIGHTELEKSIALTEKFWCENEEKQIKRFSAAVHALFLAQNPTLLQFERFLFLYMALDACYRLIADANPPNHHLSHAERIEWMCQRFNINVPSWATPQENSNAEIANIRNDAIHEALYMGKPLGFAVHKSTTGVSITLEMSALINRLLVAILGGKDAAYVRTSTNTRQRYRLDLP